LEQALRRAERLIEGGRAQEAVELLTPLVESHRWVADVHYMLGYARVSTGDIWGALGEYERALELSHDPGYWPPLASLYTQMELNAHALKALRQSLRHPDYIPPESYEGMRQALTMMEEVVAQMSHSLGIPVRRVEKGLYEMEEGIRDLNQSDYASSAAASQRAVRVLGDWPPPHNNLSLALFYDGHPEEAVAAARKVLAHDPDNVQALSNAVRFLTWSEREEEARTLWARLEDVEPQDATERIKIAEAFAILGEDESVYRVLRPLDKAEAQQELSPEFVKEVQFFLAVAEANTGRRGAKRRLRDVRDRYPQADVFLAALADRQPGPNWSERYPYFASSELLPRHAMQEWVDLVSRQGGMSEKGYRDRVVDFARRFPQIVPAAEKMIWEEALVDMGLPILILLDTPQARQVLRRFGSSQVGDDDDRMQALTHLAEVGEIGPDTMVRIWADGEWREVQMRQYEISDEYVSEYEPEVAELLNTALEAFKQEKLQRAERLFRRAIELEPRAKQAYHNLGALYSHQGKQEQAREMLRAAIEIDPLYVMPRCNLALLLLGDDDVQGAEEMLGPLANVTRFNPQDMAFYTYTQARILLEQDNYDAARRSLQMALEMQPEYEPAKDLLERLETLEPLRHLQDAFSSFIEEQRNRKHARRLRLQAKLRTFDPSLPKALTLYTKDALKGMGDEIIPWGGWSGLRKAELVQEIVNVLSDTEHLADIVESLDDGERAALREVLDMGGRMSWAEFDARYGNDLDESPYWNYHEPETAMGRLRLRGLLVEATVSGELLVALPVELREPLIAILRRH
jgi:tetratricopeptide (TPR) repeat protein